MLSFFQSAAKPLSICVLTGAGLYAGLVRPAIARAAHAGARWANWVLGWQS